ncbi:Hypothetical predicted protein [Octopus vulgaris]|uniref:Uncharacterized protein n=1 Tax=Octopus vulgaris TaxID=6645 RepID=A0AA36BA86_OCTVU|nr:Hypothetical predicted protein [Octopus vulgaris]
MGSWFRFLDQRESVSVRSRQDINTVSLLRTVDQVEYPGYELPSCECPICVDDEEITLEEVEIELKLLKNNKTADIVGIPGEIVKYGEEAMETALLNLLNVIWTDKKIEKWKTAIIEKLEVMVIFVVVECGRESVRGDHYSGFSDWVKQVVRHFCNCKRPTMWILWKEIYANIFHTLQDITGNTIQ